MKYKCQVCGQIIDNNEMCPFCGSDSSQIVALDTSGAKGRYRCLVCGRESDNGTYCPYCGSQRLFNLDLKKEVDTQSIEIKSDEDQVSPSSNESVATPDSKVDELNDQEINKEESASLEDIIPQPIMNEESLQNKYFRLFGELLPLESIKNPDPQKIDALYRMGINRGEKISPIEIAEIFAEPLEEVKADNINKTIDVEKDKTIESAIFKAQPLDVTPLEQTKNNVDSTKEEASSSNENRIVADLLVSVIKSELDTKDPILKSVLDELKLRLLSANFETIDLVKGLETLVEQDKKTDDKNLENDKKILDLLKILLKL